MCGSNITQSQDSKQHKPQPKPVHRSPPLPRAIRKNKINYSASRETPEEGEIVQGDTKFPNGTEKISDFSDAEDPSWVPERGLDSEEESEEVLDVTRDDKELAGMVQGDVSPTSSSHRGRMRAERLPSVKDDADDQAYRERLERIMKKASEDEANGVEEEDVQIEGGLIVRGKAWDGLLEYQQTGVCWLWELYQQGAGGIIADEMGLGKTVQTVVFLSAIYSTAQAGSGSSMRACREANRVPSLVVCPASMMVSWLREFRVWHPERRVMLLHESGNHYATKEEILAKAAQSGKKDNNGAVVVSTYSTLRIMQRMMSTIRWGCIVLDEGHRIRNPAAAISKAVKTLRARQKLVLSGQPIQNSLVELWSIFDFIFPGKLGTLPVFEEEFVLPIQMGGYKNASKLAVQTAHRSTVALRGLIAPYVLRRTKAKVARHLPGKSEHVLFCNLAPDQLKAYRDFVMGPECQRVLGNRTSLFRAIHVLLKLCNHPDLLLLRPEDRSKSNSRKVPPDDMPDYGNPERSGKMRVLREILTTWKHQGHRFLVFSQTRQVLDIIEKMVNIQLGLSYGRIDGSTAIRSRQPLIDRFNTDSSMDAMLLTTKAAGIGVSLTGANRVVLYDPHWNPSNDNQAKERSYRIGQKRNVKVYRLISKDTIEEKVYHRQIHKEFLTSKVLADPKQKRFFSRNDLRDLFVCPPPSESKNNSAKTETAQIFAEAGRDLTGRSHRVTKATVTPMGGKGKQEGSTEGNEEDDADLLNLVLGGAGWAHSALSHDKIIDQASDKSTSKEAEKRVRRAMRRLEDSTTSSRRRRSGGTLNNTLGEARAGFLDQTQSQPPLDAKALKQRIRQRQQRERDATASEPGMPGQDGCAYVARGGDSDRSLANPEDRLFLQLRAFLRCYPYGVETQRLIERFSGGINSRKDQKHFKKTLRTLATCDNGIWTMRKTTQLKKNPD
ncbi:hypothetical protein AAMO2058_000826500 [Amorphochlora amoebiformis]